MPTVSTSDPTFSNVIALMYQKGVSVMGLELISLLWIIVILIKVLLCFCFVLIWMMDL